jgi:hypothetical protein
MICLLFSRERLTGKLLCARRRRRRWSLKNLPRFTVRENRFFFPHFTCVSGFPSRCERSAGWDGICCGRRKWEKRNRAVVNPPFFKNKMTREVERERSLVTDSKLALHSSYTCTRDIRKLQTNSNNNNQKISLAAFSL